MKIVFSRKGFDSAAGGAPSPIVDGAPISLPIPAKRNSEITYRMAGYGDLVVKATNGDIGAGDLCHEDPVFCDGRWAFGQTGAAQSHLANNGVGVGDTFLFFGLFATLGRRDAHHRIFGYMRIEEVRRLGRRPDESYSPPGFLRRHPHTIGEWEENNTLYLGTGARSRHAHPALRLTKPGASPSIWRVPPWLRAAGLTYNRNPRRWLGDEELCVASRGQEFVVDIGQRRAPMEWLRGVQGLIEFSSEELPVPPLQKSNSA